MFETQKNAEIFLPPELSNGEIQCWSSVMSRLHMYWFHVVYEVSYPGDGIFSYILFLYDIEQLLHMSRDPGTRLVEVDLVTPGHMNGQNRWKMDVLNEIITGNTPHDNEPVYIFDLADDRRIVYPELSTSEDKIQNKASIFKMEKQEYK